MKIFAPLFIAGREPVLDGLRALAILLVLFTHIFQQIPNLSFVWGKVEWLSPLYNGWIGVDLFFVLSGFLVGGQVCRAFEDNSFSFYHFYARRSLRIFPAYFTILALVCFFWFIFPSVHPYFNFKENLSLDTILKNYLFVTNYFPTQQMGVGSWSLSNEEQFYLLLPIFFMLLNSYHKKTKIRVLMMVVLFALVIRMITYRLYDIGPGYPLFQLMDHIYTPFHTRMDALAAGVCAYMVYVSDFKETLKHVSSFLIFIGLIFTGFVFLTGTLGGGWFNTTLQFTLLAIGFASIILGTINDKKSYLSRLFSARIWIPIARLSYSLYLVHLLVINFTEHVFRDSNYLFLMPTAMLFGSFAIALPLYIFIETPFHQFAKKHFRFGDQKTR